MAFRVASIAAREILDSRGTPTVEVDLRLSTGAWGRAAVPSGASTGTHEAVELRDGDPRRFLGKGVRKAVAAAAGPVARAVRGKPFADQAAFDRFLVALDGTPQKSRLGANTLLGVSMAFAVARAQALGRPLYRALPPAAGAPSLPVPLFNVINGGVHADNPLDVQEFMLVPLGFPRFSEAMRAGVETYHHLKTILKKRGFSTAVGDEGGFAPGLRNTRDALECLLAAIEKAGYKPGRQIRLSLDVAATEIFRRGRYALDGRRLTSAEMARAMARLARDYPIFSIEDGLAEDDWPAWRALTAAAGRRVRLVGDDLYVTNPARIRQGVQARTSNAVLIKLNQVGTVTETLEAIRMTARAGWLAIVSHRSGETEDTFIADLAVATGAGLIKTGAPSRSERVAKYNRLLRIEEEMGRRAVYAGPRMA